MGRLRFTLAPLLGAALQDAVQFNTDISGVYLGADNVTLVRFEEEGIRTVCRLAPSRSLGGQPSFGYWRGSLVRWAIVKLTGGTEIYSVNTEVCNDPLGAKYPTVAMAAEVLAMHPYSAHATAPGPGAFVLTRDGQVFVWPDGGHLSALHRVKMPALGPSVMSALLEGDDGSALTLILVNEADTGAQRAFEVTLPAKGAPSARQVGVSKCGQILGLYAGDGSSDMYGWRKADSFGSITAMSVRRYTDGGLYCEDIITTGSAGEDLRAGDYDGYGSLAGMAEDALYVADIERYDDLHFPVEGYAPALFGNVMYNARGASQWGNAEELVA